MPLNRLHAKQLGNHSTKVYLVDIDKMVSKNSNFIMQIYMYSLSVDILENSHSILERIPKTPSK
jgi:hypothetical protein